MSTFCSGRFEADLSRLEEVLSYVERWIGDCFADEEKKMDLLVAAEEAFTNIFKHAYEHGGTVEVAVRTEPGSVSLTLVDEGRPFDPHSLPPPDLEAAPEDREVGGLGVHLMLNLVNEVRYRREEGKNMLMLIMSIGGQKGPEDLDEER